jgi:predicted  nucleic acid-binding Zn-ribbon protein
MSAGTNQNGWNEYSKLVINELERLNDGIKGLNEELQGLKQEIIQLKTREDHVTTLRNWKASIDDVTSPTQLQSSLKELQELKTFKTQAVTVWAVVQIGFGILIAILRFL